jgi:hypothetical protein
LGGFKEPESERQVERLFVAQQEPEKGARVGQQVNAREVVVLAAGSVAGKVALLGAHSSAGYTRLGTRPLENENGSG